MPSTGPGVQRVLGDLTGCGLWQASRPHFLLSLGGYSKSAPGQGKVTMLEANLQSWEGHRHIYSFTEAAATLQIPATPEARPSRPPSPCR